jgi:hypothetical protein
MTNIVNTLNEHANAIRSLGKQTVKNVIETGYRLTECKKLINDNAGESWSDWLKREFQWSVGSALNFMRVYEWARSELSTVENLDLPLKSLYLLVEPTTSTEARREIVARVQRGEKVKHKDIAAMVRKTKNPKAFFGLKAEIVTAVQDAGTKGLTTDELKIKIKHRHPQTVNSATNALAKADVLRDSGERRETSSGGGRAAIVYIFNPNPAPKKKTSAKVVDLNQHRLHATVAAMIQDGSICNDIERWARNKSKKERVQKAYRLVVPLIGESRGGILALADEQERVALADGRAEVMKL